MIMDASGHMIQYDSSSSKPTTILRMMNDTYVVVEGYLTNGCPQYSRPFTTRRKAEDYIETTPQCGDSDERNDHGA